MANELQNKLDAILEDKNTNLLPENLKAGVTCLGVEGILEEGSGIDTSDATATAADIVEGKTAYVDGEKVEGSVQERTADTISTFAANEVVDASNSGIVYAKTTSYDIPVLFRANTPIDVEIPSDKLATAIGLTANKLVEGNTILGVTGTVKVITEGGITQLKYDIDTPLEIPEGITYPFVIDGDYYKSTNKGVNSSFSYGKLWFWSDGTNPLVFEVQSYGESSCDYGIISTYDHDLSLNNTSDTANVFYSFSGSNNKSVTLTYKDIPMGIHYITFKFRKDGSSHSGDDCMRIQVSAFPEVHKTVNIYGTDSIDDLDSLPANAGDLCAVYDEESLLYRYDGTSWSCISSPSGAITMFSSINEMNSTPGLIDQNCVVYGNDFGPFTSPSADTVMTIALKQNFEYTTLEGSFPSVTSMTDANGLRHVIYAYGDEDWDWDDKPEPAKNEIVYMTQDTSTYVYTELARWTSGDGINYTTDDFEEAYIIENVTIGSYTLYEKASMVMGLVPAFFGMYTYNTAKHPEYYVGRKNWTYDHSEETENRDMSEVVKLGVEALIKSVFGQNTTTTFIDCLIAEKEENVYALYYTTVPYFEDKGTGNWSSGKPNIGMLNGDTTVKITAFDHHAYSTLGDCANPVFYRTTVNLNTKEVKTETLSKIGDIAVNTLSVAYVDEVPASNWISHGYIGLDTINNPNRSGTSMYKIYNSSDTTLTKRGYSVTVPSLVGWHYATTQFSELKPSDLYTDVYAYGKKGPMSGDGTWLNNITDVQKLKMMYSEADLLTNNNNAIVASAKNNQCLVSADMTDLDWRTRYLNVDSNLVENRHVMMEMDAEVYGYATPDENYILDFIKDKTNLKYIIQIKNKTGEILHTKEITTTAGSSNMYYNLQITENYAWLTMYTASNVYTVVRAEYATGAFTTTTVSTSGYAHDSDIVLAADVKYNCVYLGYSSWSSDNNRAYVVSYSNGTLSSKSIGNKTFHSSGDIAIRFSDDGTYVTIWLYATGYDQDLERHNYNMTYYKYTRSSKSQYTSGSVTNATEMDFYEGSGGIYQNALYSEDSTYWYIGSYVYTKKGIRPDNYRELAKKDLLNKVSVDLQYSMSYNYSVSIGDDNSDFIIQDIVNNITKTYINNKTGIVTVGNNTPSSGSGNMYFLKYTDTHILVALSCKDGNNESRYILGKIQTYTDSDFANCNVICLPSVSYMDDEYAYTRVKCMQYTMIDKRITD